MGFLYDSHRMMLAGTTPPGACPECAVKHDLGQPHDQASLAYRYKFYDRHGRWPSWEDAMAHCDDGVKAQWAAQLRRLGVDVSARPETQSVDIVLSAKEAGNV